MAVHILSTNFETAKNKIVEKFQENSRKPAGEKKITTWELKGSAASAYRLHFTPPNWGDCGYFELQKTVEGKLRLALFLYKEHYKKGDKWPTCQGALHGDLIQLLLNHFPELANWETDALKVVHTVNCVE